eukprot:358070-Chlamydomonas_euryale.AAC.3
MHPPVCVACRPAVQLAAAMGPDWVWGVGGADCPLLGVPSGRPACRCDGDLNECGACEGRT